MKYYIYISDTKVDMLLPQVPFATKSKVAAEMKFDLKLLSASIGTERMTLEDRVARLHTVERHILRTCEVGDLEAKSPWVKDITAATVVKWEEGLVFFFGRTANVRFGLGGSVHHVIGHVRQGSTSVSLSFLPDLLHTLAREVDQLHDKDEEEIEDRLQGSVSYLGTYPWARVVRAALEKLCGPQQRVEFLARRLLIDDDYMNYPAGQILLATPLYVALSE